MFASHLREAEKNKFQGKLLALFQKTEKYAHMNKRNKKKKPEKLYAPFTSACCMPQLATRKAKK
jgi:hypothetical protein